MAQLHGKQLKDASVADAKLVVAYIKADGTRAFTGNQSLGGNKLTSVGDATADSDVPSFKQLKDYSIGLREQKDPVRVATTAALAANTRSGNVLTASANGALAAQDGITLVANDRILVKNEATGANNGIYYVSDVGSAGTPWTLTRTTDADDSTEVEGGMRTWVNEGTTNGDSGFVLTTDNPITLNTTALTFTKFSGLGQITAGAGMTKTGDTIDVGAGLGIQVDADSVTLKLNANAGLTKNNGAGTDELAVNPGAGLELSSNAVRIAAAAAGNGLSGGGGSALAVLAVNDSVNVSGSGVKAAVPKNVDKAKSVASPTSGNDANTALTITNTPGGDSYVAIFVNGIKAELGDGVKTKDCYFSADGGTTARAMSAITAADTLFWNGTISGFDLATTDELDFDYNVA